MSEDDKDSDPVALDITKLNALINQMIGELLEGKQTVTHDPKAPNVFRFSLKVDGKGVEIVNPEQGQMVVQNEHVEKEPLIDVLEDKDRVTVIAELPGAKKENIDVVSDSTKVSIKAEARSGIFSKSVNLNSKVNPRSARALYNNGVLEIVLKKSASYKGAETKIDVK